MRRPAPRQNNPLPDGRPVKITFGQMRGMGVHGVLIYCADYRCGHLVTLDANHWPDEVRLSDI